MAAGTNGGGTFNIPPTRPLLQTPKLAPICKYCGSTKDGWLQPDLDDRGDVIRVRQFCSDCDRYHAWYPKDELGLATRKTRRDHLLGNSAWMRCLERHAYSCVACHRKDLPLHQGHLISKAEGAAAGIPNHILDDEVNIAPFCEVCNSGLGGHSAGIRLTYFAIRQALEVRHRGEAA